MRIDAEVLATMVEALKDARAALAVLFPAEDSPQYKAMLACDAAIQKEGRRAMIPINDNEDEKEDA